MNDEALDTYQKLEDASHAMGRWMQSQGLLPADGVMLAEWFIARMIIDNATNPQDIERKICLQDSTLRTFTKIIQVGVKKQ